jgi:hypothetical protein
MDLVMIMMKQREREENRLIDLGCACRNKEIGN